MKQKTSKFIWLITALLVIFGCSFLYLELQNAPSVVEDNNINMPKTEHVPLATATPESEQKTSFTFAGDMMFDRLVNHTFKNIGFDQIFANLDKTYFANKDVCFANLEGPVSDQAIIDDYPARSLVFNMPPETIVSIKSLGLNGVSLANNHTLNAGAKGFATTEDLLKNANIKYGGSQNNFDEGSVIRYDSGIPVSIIAVDYLAYTNLGNIAASIQKEKGVGRFVIVFPHWGEEYSLTHSQGQRTAAQSFINAGADLIIGSHPHVVQDIEVINNVPVFYSIGNFVFDQTFSKDTQEGLILTGTITKKSLEINILPFRSANLKPSLMNEIDKKIILDRINKSNESIIINY